MSFRNVGRIFLFVFILCFVSLSLCWSQGPTWNIPDSVKIKYPEKTTKKDWMDLQRDLQHIFENFKNDIEEEYFQGNRRRYKPDAISQMLVNKNAVIVHGGEVYTTKEKFGDLLRKYDPRQYQITITWRNEESSWIFIGGIEKVDQIDIISFTKFDIGFTHRSKESGDNGQPGDVFLCETTSYHRKITTWF